ncbi:hypothetical protein D3C80_1600610 [compost metagenome]
MSYEVAANNTETVCLVVDWRVLKKLRSTRGVSPSKVVTDLHIFANSFDIPTVEVIAVKIDCPRSIFDLWVIRLSYYGDLFALKFIAITTRLNNFSAPLNWVLFTLRVCSIFAVRGVAASRIDNGSSYVIEQEDLCTVLK